MAEIRTCMRKTIIKRKVNHKTQAHAKMCEENKLEKKTAI